MLSMLRLALAFCLARVESRCVGLGTFDQCDFRGLSPTFDGHQTVYMPTGGFYNTSIVAVDAVSGFAKWSYNVPDIIPGLHWDIQAPISMGYDGTVYFRDVAGALYALDGREGELKWKVNVSTFKSDDNLLVVPMVSVDKEGFLYTVVDKLSITSLYSNGTLRWKSVLNASQSYDLIAGIHLTIGDGSIIYANSQLTHWAIDSASGSVLWQEDISSELAGMVWEAPVLGSNGLLYYASGKLPFIEAHSTIQARNSTSGKLVWSVQLNDTLISEMPALDSANNLYFCGRESCFSFASTGELLWQTGFLSYFLSAPEFCHGVVYVGGAKEDWIGNVGHLIALNASSGSELWRYQPDLHDPTVDPTSDFATTTSVACGDNEADGVYFGLSAPISYWTGIPFHFGLAAANSDGSEKWTLRTSSAAQWI